jgi:hypothetical protein
MWCIIPHNGKNELLSFTTALYNYCCLINYINLSSGRLDRGMDFDRGIDLGLQKRSPEEIIYFAALCFSQKLRCRYVIITNCKRKSFSQYDKSVLP